MKPFLFVYFTSLSLVFAFFKILLTKSFLYLPSLSISPIVPKTADFRWIISLSRDAIFSLMFYWSYFYTNYLIANFQTLWPNDFKVSIRNSQNYLLLTTSYSLFSLNSPSSAGGFFSSSLC